MNAAAVERLMLKSKLRRALERDELVILYQPKVDLRDGRVVGAEALLRWRLPGHGDISPSQFIPLAEETSLILDIGEWVLNRVCSDYREWQKTVPQPGRIAINLSLEQLKQASFITRCRTVFRRHDVSPDLLRTGGHRDDPDDRPEAHHRAVERAVRDGPAIWRSTISAPAIRRCPLCSSSRSAP